MKRSLPVILAVLVCLQLACSTNTQNSSAPGAPGASTTSPEVSRLERFKGEWSTSSMVRESPNVTMQFGNTTITQPTPNAVTFKCSLPTSMSQFGPGPSEDYEVTLRYDAGQKTYLLDAKLGSGSSIKDLPMTYSETDGYAGKGKATGSKGEMAAEATIKNDKEKAEGHIWSITLTDDKRKAEHEFKFSKPTESAQPSKSASEQPKK